MLSSWRICCGQVQQRWIFAVMACLAILNAYAIRICLSLTITAMVAKTESSSNSTSSDNICPVTTESTSSSSSSSGTYEWDEYTKGIILSSFYWGYLVTQLPGGILADRYGGKYILGLGILSTAIFSIITPVVVENFDSTGLIVLRVLMGFGEGMTFPAMSVMISQWAPPLERSKITSLAMSGMAMGTVIANALTGVLIQYSSIGWPIVFYIYGGFGIVWFCAWVVLCYSHPDVHPFISEKEKKYLHETVNRQTQNTAQPTPWRHILTTYPFWALVFAKFGFSAGYKVMLTDLPLYMSDVLHYSIGANGYLSALPHILLWIVANVTSWLADWLIKTERMSRTNVRKGSHSIATLLPAIFTIAASYTGCDRTIVVILFAIGVGAMGPFYITVMINPNDLTPNHAGALMAVVSSISAFTGIVAPYLVGILTPNQTVAEWRLVFWITFGLFVGSALVFNVWGSGDVQYWDDLDAWNDQRKDIEGKKPANERKPSSKLPYTSHSQG